MTTVESALAAMDAAEQEASRIRERSGMLLWWWARDRLRLIARDRATLERHQARGGLCEWCSDDALVSARAWPCPEVRAVADYWQEDA